MHILPLHIGDISQATGRCTTVQMGIYLRLLMEYYKGERPLPDDVEELAWTAGVMTKGDREALESVLKRFFVHDAEGKCYRQKRADREIEGYRVAGLKKRYAILCRWWKETNPGVDQPSFEVFAADVGTFFDDVTGRVRVYVPRNTLVLQEAFEGDTSLPPPNYVPVTSNQFPVTSNHVPPIAPQGGPTIEQLAEAIYGLYPRKVGRPPALKAIVKILKAGEITELDLQAKVREFAACVAKWPEQDKPFIPHPATWFNQQRYMDDPATWRREPVASTTVDFRAQKKEGAPPPEGWREAWAALYDLACPATWDAIATDVQVEIRTWLVEREKKEGGRA
jgi:hypothetical protein